MNSSIVLGLALLVGICAAKDIQFGSCPKVPVPTNFSLETLLGGWYVVKASDSGWYCRTQNFTKINDQTVQITDKGIDVTQVGRQGNGEIDAKKSNLLHVSFAPGSTSNWYVADTDNETYLVIFTCDDPYKVFRTQTALILSRSLVLSRDSKLSAYQKLSKLGFPLTMLQNIGQGSGCAY